MRTRGKDTTPTDAKSSQKLLTFAMSPDEEDSNEPKAPQNSPVGSSAPTKLACLATTPRVQDLMRRFADHAYASYVQGTPALSHLSLLVRYNVSSALLRNADILGVGDECRKWEGVSPFVKYGPAPDPTSAQRSIEWPTNLQPTPIQCSIEHHPWLDVFPWPRVRDNMLQAFEHLGIDGEDELCHDVSEYEGHETDPMLVVWGDAWDPNSWEFTPNFLQKWGWLLSGCDETLEATNHWRTKRGERPISQRELHEAIGISVPAKFQHAVL